MPSIPTSATSASLVSDLIHRSIAILSSDYSNNGYHSLAVRKVDPAISMVNLAARQRHIIQLASTITASVSITAALLALYWFSLMRRNFRRDLVLLLILGDVLKNFCYVMFGSVNLAHAAVEDSNAFCQASGYILQTGFEACDVAVFFVSLHMTLQIFPLPNTRLGYDGLYNVRHWVFALWVILPNLSASLAFVNGPAYQVQGAWCWLPVRPFWYRLALGWVPRYIIASLILGFAIAIYTHIGKEFSLLGRARDRAVSTDLSSNVLQSRTDCNSTVDLSGSFGLDQESKSEEPPAHPASSSDNRAGILRRASLPAWNSPFDGQIIDDVFRGTHSEAGSRRGSRQVTFNFSEEALSPEQLPGNPATHPMPLLTPRASYIRSSAAESAPSMPVLEESKTAAEDGPSLDAAVRARQKAIRRQVRSLFIYPVAYIIFWIIPFVSHCLNYSDYYAANPVFPISLLSSICTSSLGLVDVIIFSWREQPWHHIPGSDGTFLGSLCFWRFGNPPSLHDRASISSNVGKDSDHSKSCLRGALSDLKWHRLSSSAGKFPLPSHSPISKPRTQGGADSEVREREQAHQRLLIEQRAAAGLERQAANPDRPSPGGRNWFDNIEEEDESMMKSRRPTWSGH